MWATFFFSLSSDYLVQFHSTPQIFIKKFWVADWECKDKQKCLYPWGDLKLKQTHMQTIQSNVENRGGEEPCGFCEGHRWGRTLPYMGKLDQILTRGQHLKSLLKNDYKLVRKKYFWPNLSPSQLFAYMVKIHLEMNSPRFFPSHKDTVVKISNFSQMHLLFLVVPLPLHFL